MPRRSGSETRKRSLRLSVRFNDQEASAVRQTAQATGQSVGSLIRQAALNAAPTRAPALDRQLAAKLLGQLGKIGSNLNQLAKEAHLGRYRADSIELNLRDLTELRLPLLQALGREPAHDHPQSLNRTIRTKAPYASPRAP